MGTGRSFLAVDAHGGSWSLPYQKKDEDQEHHKTRRASDSMEAAPAPQQGRALGRVEIQGGIEEELGRRQDHEERKGNHGAEQEPTEKPSKVAPDAPPYHRGERAPMTASEACMMDPRS